MEDRERLLSRIGVPVHAVEAYCERWRVKELAVFGSALRDGFGPDSDIDILVSFRTERTPGLFGFGRMERELAVLFGRRIDQVH